MITGIISTNEVHYNQMDMCYAERPITIILDNILSFYPIASEYHSGKTVIKYINGDKVIIDTDYEEVCTLIQNKMK